MNTDSRCREVDFGGIPNRPGESYVLPDACCLCQGPIRSNEETIDTLLLGLLFIAHRKCVSDSVDLLEKEKALC